LITISFIATAKYKDFFPGFYERVQNFFCINQEKKILVSTDDPESNVFKKENVITRKIDHKVWPYVTLHRFKYLLDFKNQIRESDNFYFIDADLWPESDIEISEISDSRFDLVGVQHPGFVGKIGTFETNTRSLANIFDGKYDLTKYRQGCFWGGKSSQVIRMIEELDRRIDQDDKNGVIARWHDESHMNKYFIERNSSVLTLHPGFAQPETGYDHIRHNFPTKMIHLSKNDGIFPRFPGGSV
jgi:hypothetical protein